MTPAQRTTSSLPPRIELPGLASFSLLLIAALALAQAANGVGFSLIQLAVGLPHIQRILGEMLPPNLEHIDRIGAALLETFQMALVGTAVGVVGSFFLAMFASRAHSPHALIYAGARAWISFFRTVPDLVWALLFVVAVGLG